MRGFTYRWLVVVSAAASLFAAAQLLASEREPSAKRPFTSATAKQPTPAKTSRALIRALDRIEADRRAAPRRPRDYAGLTAPNVRADAHGRLQVYIAVRGVDDIMLDELRSLGIEIEVVNSQLRMIQAWVPHGQLERLAELDYVLRVTTPSYAQPRSGSVFSEGDAIVRANELRQLGYLGSGVKVGVISDGANALAAAQATGDLPAEVSTFGACSPRDTDPAACDPGITCNEGTAILEIIHDLAPGAQLAIAAASTTLEFAQQIDALVNSWGADIVVDDLGFFFEPYFSNGIAAEAVAAAANQVLYVSAAGNSGLGHYEANYRSVIYDETDLHDFGRTAGAGLDASMNVTVEPGEFMGIILQWNDPFGASANDYDLYLVNTAETDTLCPFCFSDEAQEGFEDPVEAICYHNATETAVSGKIGVNRWDGASKRIELVMIGGEVDEYNDPAGSIFGHAGLPNVVTVGAINAEEPGNDAIAPYSAQGPSRIDFPTLQVRSKPDLMGIDGVSVSGAGDFPTTFYGTSAAAPHVAGVAALIRSIPGVTNPEAIQALRNGAVDLGIAGRDNVYGYGRVDAIAALQAFDEDTDGIADSLDNCPDVPNSNQADFDQDGAGDACDADDDNDGTPDATDAFPRDASETLDTDNDGIGNNADEDDDGDGLPDEFEISIGLDPLQAADAQGDLDHDGATNIEEYLAGRNPRLNEPVVFLLILGGDEEP